MSEHASEGFEHLQAAAIELIAAARAFLDVAEDLVREPGAAATIVTAAASVGRAVIHGSSATGVSDDDDSDQGKVRHIHVS